MTDLVDVVGTREAVAPEGDPSGPKDGKSRPARRPFARAAVDVLGSLGARLVAGVVALVIVVVVSSAAGTYLALDHYLSGRLSTQLSQTEAQIGTGFFSSENGPRAGGRMGPSPQHVWLSVYQANGAAIVLPEQSTYALKLGSDQVRYFTTHSNKQRNVTTTDGEKLRAVAKTVSLTVVDTSGAITEYTNVVAVVGLTTSEVRGEEHHLIVLESAIGAGAVLLALLISAWGVSVGLRPLKRVTRTAQEVTAELSPAGAGLDRRVPESGTTEVGQLATSFNTMLDQVQTEFTARRESEERMRQFLADASHELRTPLTSIRGYAELARLQRGRQQAPDPEDDSIGRIETEGTRMSRLVEDLLLLARGDDATAVAKRVPVDLAEQIAQAVEGVRIAYPHRVITISLAPNLRVLGDPDQLLRVLRNLVGNAAVHTDETSPIRVTGRREQSAVVLQVADGGPGLPPDEAAHVFERFWRADKARTRVRGGSGLGMSIVAQIVGAHAGDVVFDSSVADGTTVTIVLPAMT